LAFGFISVPPFTSLVSKIIYLLGGGLFWVRFFPALFGALTIVFTWLIVESLGGKLWSKILAASAVLFSIIVRINTLFQPNSFEILAWIMIFYLLIKFIQSEKTKWLYYLAIMIALAFCNKYNVAFLLTGLVAGLLLTSQRKIFANFSTWKALLLLVILLLPNLIWQIVHHFPVVEHMRVLKRNQLDNNTSIDFLKSQLMVFVGSLSLVALALFAFIQSKPFKKYRFIGIGFIVTIILFTCLKAKNYYAFGLYPVMFAVGSVYLESILTRKWKLIIIPPLVIANLATFILTASIIYPVMTPTQIKQHAGAFEKFGMLRWEDGKNHSLPQDFADMIGWREMADKALVAYKMIPADELKNTLVFCDNYGQTGALNYYNRKKMPGAYSFNTDYIFWLPRLERIQNVLLVGDEPDDKIKAMFKEVKLVGVVENELAREKGTGIFLMTGANDDVTTMFYGWADDRIKRNDIF
jgi:hypothetical protein